MAVALGAAATVGCWFRIYLWILGPIAWVLGHRTLREIDADPRRYTNRSTALVGRALGMAGTLAVPILILLVALVAG